VPIQPPIQWVPGAFPGGNAVGREAGHSRLVPESRMRGAIPPLFPCAFMAWCSVKAQGQLYLYFTHIYYKLKNFSNFETPWSYTVYNTINVYLNLKE